MALVYIATNIVNGKQYIGVTEKTLRRRKARHFSPSNLNSSELPFARALKKYGKKGFLWDVVKDGLTEDEAYELEEALIKECREQGYPLYNVADGGKGTRPSFQPVFCVTDNMHYLSVQEAAKAYGLSESCIVQKCQTGAKTKSGLRFRYDGDNSCNRGGKSLKVACLNDGQVHRNALAASKHYNISRGSISDACRGASVSAHGLYFCYCNEDFSEDDRQRLLAISKQRHAAIADNRRLAAVKRNGRPVKCLNDSKWYETGRAAATAYNINRSVVYNSCKSGGITQGGLRFMFADQETPVEQLPKGFHNRKKVKNIDDRIVYESMVAAGKALGRSDCAIRAAIKHNTKCAGKRLAYAA